MYSSLAFHIANVIFLWICIVLYFYFRKRQLKAVYHSIMTTLNQSYLCGYSLFMMIRDNFINRFANFNHEGFCFTFSATIMLSLKKYSKSRLVRGRIVDEEFDSDHSWVELKLLGTWWVIDPCFYVAGFSYRHYYYRTLRPQIEIIYDYQTFWSDPLADEFYQRMRKPEASYLFVNLYARYTPDKGSLRISSPESYLENGYDFLENGQYYLFPPDHHYHFSQEIVNDFMARPTHRSPKLRSLRRLDRVYRQMPQ